MKKHMIGRCIDAFVLALGALTLAGCAAIAPATPEQAVRQRATEYWKARVTGQVDKAYVLTTPSYRKLRTETQYKSQFGSGVSVRGAEVTMVTCEPQKCTVRMKVSAAPALMGVKVDLIDTHFDEIWLLEDGQWWRHHEL